ncbi:ATP-binding protein [Natronorubrum sulfidifaciens]|uniref:ATP-binding protein n=1 Tax=Natronorubrum sulfidifaciens TaxID=388259 RepID=UPI000677911A|nr:DUF87 domain-containing protein [Natronorubrum sulfidifaciens]
MSFVLGRGDRDSGPVGHLGRYRALDGTSGAPLYCDLDGPHAVTIVGKRGYGKSYTMGVLAEELAKIAGLAPVIIDPMGAFETLAEPNTAVERDDEIPATVINDPTVKPTALDPRSWCGLLGLSPEQGAGGLVWQAAQQSSTIAEMRTRIDDTDAPLVDKRAARNHLRLADTWDVFDATGLEAADLAGPEITIIDISGLESAPMNAVCRGVAEALYRARVTETIARLPWLLLDEAHTFFSGVAEPALERILTRGRAPGVSLVAATQRPSAVPELCLSQSDLLFAHRLTAQSDLEALAASQPTYMNGSLADADRLPDAPGEVVVVDDSTETVHAVQIRTRETAHGGDSPQASDIEV